MTVPTVSLQIAPGARAGDQNPSWTEIGDRLLSFNYKRGRQYETDTMQAGTASFALQNTDRALDPSYTRGPFYGRLAPNMQIRFRGTIGGTTYDLFRGFVERWPFDEGLNFSSITLDCVDRFAALAQATVTGTFAEQLTGARITAVLSAAGWTTTAVPSGWTLGTSALGISTVLGVAVPTNVIDVGKATVAAVTLSGELALTHIQEVEKSEPGIFYFDGQGRAVFRARNRVTPVPEASVLTLTDDASAADATHVYYMRPFVPTFDIDRVMNDIELTAQDATLASVSDPVSIDMNWRRTLSRATRLRGTGSSTDLLQQAGYLLYTMKDARRRIEQVTVPLSTTLAYQAVLVRELGEHLTVVRTPTGAAVSETITQESQLESISVSGDPGAWSVTLQLSPMLQAGFVWTLGTSRLGIDTRLAYA